MVPFLHISCEKIPSTTVSEGLVQIKFNVYSANSTKSASLTHRDVINSLDIFVFKAETGELISYDNIKGESISLYLQRGVLHDICFIANAPKNSFDNIKYYAELETSVSNLIDNHEAYVMQGKESRMFLNDGNLNVEISRLCSKITVDAITPKFMETAISQQHVVLKRMFLMHSSPVISYFGGKCISDVLYNDLGFDTSLDTKIQNLISYGYDKIIVDSSKLDLNTSLLTYSIDESDLIVSQTKLVLEVEIAGIPNYYTAQLPRLQPNHEYLIENIKLLGFGSNIPGELIDRVDVTVNIIVNSWGGVVDKDAVMD